jgi:cellulose synthase/poly-beta-1,6-N-acetylglucosamine synthase-like glycosyltransferase
MNMISVIVPTLNEEGTLEATMKRLKTQDYDGDYEIIVADGMSEDKTINIAVKYADKVIAVKKKGIAAGRNAGAKAAKGDILVFVDADTLLLPNVLGEIESSFRDEHVVGVVPTVYPMDSSLMNVLPYWFFHRLSRASTRTGNPLLGGMCVAYRRDAFEGVGGFDERLGAGEDLDLSLRLRKSGKFKALNDVYAYTSARRLDEWGRFRYIYRYIKAYLFGKLGAKMEYERVG